MGVIAQLNLVVVVLGAVCSAGLGNAVVQQVAAARAQGDEQEARRVEALALLLTVTLALVALAITAVCADGLADHLLGDADLGVYVLIAAASVPLNMIIVVIGLTLQGERQVSRLAGINLISGLLSTAVAVPLIYAFGLGGAVVAILATSGVSLVYALSRAGSALRCISVRPLLPSRATRVQLRRLGSASVAMTVSLYVVEGALRSRLVNQSGLGDNGLYQVPMLFTSQVFIPLLAGITAFLLPGLSAELVRPAAFADLFARAWRLALGVALVFSTLLLVTRHLAIQTVFSSAFLQAERLLVLHVVGLVALALTYVSSVALLASSLPVRWFIASGAQVVVYLICGVLLLPSMGVNALSLGFAASWIVGAVTALLLVPKEFVRRADHSLPAIALVLALILISASTQFVDAWATFILALLVLAGALRLLATPAERATAWSLLRGVLSSGRQSEP